MLTLPELLRQFRRHRRRAPFRGEESRRERVVTEIRKARLTGIRVPVTIDALEGAPLGGCPARSRTRPMSNAAGRAGGGVRPGVSALRKQPRRRVGFVAAIDGP